MDIKSEKIELVGVDTLIPYSKNMNKHTPDQIDRLIKLIEYQGFRDPLIVQKGTNIIAAGHGRWEAAKKMGLKEIPVVYQEFDSEAQFYSFVVSHNAINSSNWGGGLDLSQINIDLAVLGPELDIDILGIKDFTIEPMENLDDLTQDIHDDLNKKFLLEIQFPNDMEMMDIHDDLVSRGYLVRIKK